MSVLGVATQFFAEPRLAFTVPPEVFIPPPKVESAVVILEVREEPPLPAELQPLFFKLVNAGFRQKRKQVANSIADVLQLPKAGIAGLALRLRRRSDAASGDAVRRGMGDADEVRATGCRRGVTAYCHEQ